MNAPASTHRPLPKRVRPFEKTRTPTPGWLRRVLGRELAPSEREYREAGEALWHGDPLMDDWVDWMYRHGPREGRALFEQALASGIDSLEAPPQPLRALFREVERRPDWLRPELLDEGARFIHGTGLTAPYVLRDLALMGGYMLSGFNQALVKTGALNKGASRRIAETGKWWVDCTEPGGLERHATGFETTLHVRMVHALVRRNLSLDPEWDMEQWGLPLSQIDMAATYLGFSVVMLGGLRKMGVPVTRRESQAVMHLWRYACWLMGVDEKWLVDTEREGIVLLHHTFMTQSRPDWTSRELARALAREPLERQYPRWRALRQRLAWRQHLSVSRYFLGRNKMEQLGLPTNITPWYPLLTLPWRFISYSLQRMVPPLNRWQQRRGRTIQLDTLAAMFGDGEHDVIRPSGDHPAST